MGVLRWRRLLDFLLERQLKKPVEQLDLPVAIALRMGTYQLRFLEKIPARAAVNESVELVKRARKASAASLVNAVLRRMAEDSKTPAENYLPPKISPAERLAILHSHPTWMVERWLSRLGETRTVALLEANNRAPRLSCALHDADHREEIIRDLEKAGLRVEPGQLLKAAFAVSGGSPARTEAFRAGQISIQDEASQAIPLLLGVRPGDRVLDLCAAPGGKTPALVRAAGSEGTRRRRRPPRAPAAGDAGAIQAARPRWRAARRTRRHATAPLRAASSTGFWWTLRAPARARSRGIRKFAGGCAPSSLPNRANSNRGCCEWRWPTSRAAAGSSIRHARSSRKKMKKSSRKFCGTHQRSGAFPRAKPRERSQPQLVPGVESLGAFRRRRLFPNFALHTSHRRILRRSPRKSLDAAASDSFFHELTDYELSGDRLASRHHRCSSNFLGVSGDSC